MSATDNRYVRHVQLKAFGQEAQDKILASRALVIGAGGLGSPVCLYLAASGLNLTVCDFDDVDVSNLQRQIIHNESSVGVNKAESAKTTLRALNSTVSVDTVTERLTPEKLSGLVARCDIVVDCTDNFRTRSAVNRACTAAKKPLVSGATVGFDGQVSVFNAEEGAPCYACLYPESETYKDIKAADIGVFAPVVGIVGTIMAAETLKTLAGTGDNLSSRLLIIDALSMTFTELSLEKNPDCPVCNR